VVKIGAGANFEISHPLWHRWRALRNPIPTHVLWPLFVDVGLLQEGRKICMSAAGGANLNANSNKESCQRAATLCRPTHRYRLHRIENSKPDMDELQDGEL